MGDAADPASFWTQRESNGEGESKFMDDPIFDRLKSIGILMTEMRKKEIFDTALRVSPHIQQEFNHEILWDTDTIACWQWRLCDGRIIWSPGMFNLMSRDPEIGPPPYDEIHLKFVDGEEKDRYLCEQWPHHGGETGFSLLHGPMRTSGRQNLVRQWHRPPR